MKYDTLAPRDSINKTIKALTKGGFLPESVTSGVEALSRIKELIPAGASVMNGTSRTLDEIGFVKYLKEESHGWSNLHETILAEKDSAKQMALRKQSVLSDFYLGSAHAIAETGEIVIASNSGSQLPHIAFTSPNIILVVGAQKIMPTLPDAFRRLNEYVVPLENERIKGLYGFDTMHAKSLILHKENPMLGRKVHILFVNEKLGF